MSPSDAGDATVKRGAPGHDADNAAANDAAASYLSIGHAVPFDAEAEDFDIPPRRRASARERIIDVTALNVVTADPEPAGGWTGFAAGLRRYAPAGAFACAALALGFVGGGLLQANRAGTPAADAVKVEAAHHAPPPVVLKDPETSRQMAQMAIDVRLLSARVETLRATVEGRQSGDGERALKKSVDALRAGLEQSKVETTRALGLMSQKLDKLPHEPGAKMAQLAERLDRVERHVREVADVTGSIAKPAASVATSATPKPSASSPRASASSPKPVESAKPVEVPKPPVKPAAALLPGPKIITPVSLPEAKPQPKIIPGFVLRAMEGDVAIVEGRGEIFELSSGDNVPGIGRVERFERRGRDFVVVTSRGLISSLPQE